MIWLKEIKKIIKEGWDATIFIRIYRGIKIWQRKKKN